MQDIEHKNEFGQLHREGDLPAVEWEDGGKEWWVEGKRHRSNDLPAIIYESGGKEWHFEGKLHREEGPAIELSNGAKAWYVNGQLHRIGGPAREYADGNVEWWVNGVRKMIGQWVEVQKPNTMLGEECCITLEKIQLNSEVCKCHVCSVTILFEALEKWLDTSDSKSCPHCRCIWTSNVKYI